jgi:hypothetical protein
MDTIRFDADKYEWAEVAGLGMCLVPKPPAPRVRPSDICEGRRIENHNGSAIWTVWRLRRPDEGYFWTLLCFDTQGVVAPSRESLASQIDAWPAGWRWLS